MPDLQHLFLFAAAGLLIQASREWKVQAEPEDQQAEPSPIVTAPEPALAEADLEPAHR